MGKTQTSCFWTKFYFYLQILYCEHTTVNCSYSNLCANCTNVIKASECHCSYVFCKAGSETFRCFINAKLNQAANTNVRPRGIEASGVNNLRICNPILNFNSTQTDIVWHQSLPKLNVKHMLYHRCSIHLIIQNSWSHCFIKTACRPVIPHGTGQSCILYFFIIRSY